MLLKNAYVFKEQCEKVDMFLREYLENLKKANLNAETVAPDFADLVYTPNFLDDNTPELTDVSQDRNLFEEINNDPKIHMDQVIERDMHSVKVKYNI